MGMFYLRLKEAYPSKITVPVFKWIENAAVSGDPIAQEQLGFIYSLGVNNVVESNKAKAFYWTQQAAKQEYTLAQYNLYLMLSQYNLYLMYYKREGVERNDTMAAYLLKETAKKGLIIAQCTLGSMYIHGIGVAQNIDMGSYWLQQAARFNFKPAGNILNLLDTRADRHNMNNYNSDKPFDSFNLWTDPDSCMPEVTQNLDTVSYWL